MIRDVSSLKPDSIVTVSTWLLNKGELLLAVDDPGADISDSVQFRLETHFVDLEANESVRDEVFSSKRSEQIAAIERYGPTMRSVRKTLYSCVDAVDLVISRLILDLGSQPV